MDADEQTEAHRLDGRRAVYAVQGRTAPPRRAGPLTGVAGGLAVALVLGIVVFGAVLATSGRRQAAARAAAAAATTPATDALDRVGAWSLTGQPEPVVQDGSGLRRDATVVGRTTATAGPRKDTKALLLAGGSLVTAGSVLDPNRSWSVSAWVRLDRLPAGFATAASQDAGPVSAFYLQYAGPDRRWALSAVAPDGSAAVRSLGAPARARRWYHLVGVRDAGSRTLQLYVDDVAAAAVPAPPVSPARGPFRIGAARYGAATVDPWPGAVARVDAFQRALTPAEVDGLFRAGP